MKSKRQRPKDSTVLSKLSTGQIAHLQKRIKDGLIVERCGTMEEDSWCHRSTLPLDSGGYPKSLRLTQKAIGTNANADIVDRGVTFNWNAAGVVLVADGRHAADCSDEASHLCNHPWCVRPEHLLWETPKDNYRRKNCTTFFVCSVCSTSHNPCRHDPQCVDQHLCDCEAHHQGGATSSK